MYPGLWNCASFEQQSVQVFGLIRLVVHVWFHFTGTCVHVKEMCKCLHSLYSKSLDPLDFIYVKKGFFQS